jgi:ketosteroid isomerase-like protein
MARIEEAKRGVHQALAEWTDAELKGDCARLDQILTDDFVAVGPLGFVLPKQEWLARYEQGTFRNKALRLEEVQTRVHGDVAVVTAHQIQKSVFGESEVPFTDLRATLVVVNQSGAWRLAAVHMSFIAGTPGAPEAPVPQRTR